MLINWFCVFAGCLRVCTSVVYVHRLTAYVSRVLGEAQDYIFVDTQVLVKAVDWIVGRQNKDGSFNEFGKVLDRSMQVILMWWAWFCLEAFCVVFVLSPSMHL